MSDEAETAEVMHAFADCLREIYLVTGLAIPDDFYPDKEAARILSAASSSTKAETNGMRRAAYIAEGSTTLSAAVKQIRREALRIDSILGGETTQA